MQHRIVALVSAMVLLLSASVAQASQCGAKKQSVQPETLGLRGDVTDPAQQDDSEPPSATSLDPEAEIVLVPTSPVPATFDATIPVEVRRAPAEDCDGIALEGDDVPMCASEGASEVAPKPVEPTSDAAITAPPCEDVPSALASVTQNDDDRHDPPTASPAGHAVLPAHPALPSIVLRGDELPPRVHAGPRAGVDLRVERPPQG